MDSLSNLLKKTEVFQHEFDKIFPAQTFNKVNILSYITVCTEIVLNEAGKKYPDHGIKFINPVFIVDRQIYPASNLPGDTTILKLTRPFFNLVQTKAIVPLSIPILDNLLSGVCLFYGDTYGRYEYKLFKTCNLDDLIPSVGLNTAEMQGGDMIDQAMELQIDVEKLSETFNEFSGALSANSDQEKIRLIKTLVLYRDISRTLSPSFVFSFINRYNQSHSFFDCLLTFISEQPFDEDELLDFALITEGISSPIANYDFNKSKGISSQTMAKRNSLRTSLINSFKKI